MTNWYRFICVFDLCLHVFVSESINKVRNSKILQYDTFLYTGMCGMTINYMNPFKKQSNNLEEEPGNIALNGRNKVVKKKRDEYYRKQILCHNWKWNLVRSLFAISIIASSSKKVYACSRSILYYKVSWFFLLFSFIEILPKNKNRTVAILWKAFLTWQCIFYKINRNFGNNSSRQ